jgi:hypothetical protein
MHCCVNRNGAKLLANAFYPSISGRIFCQPIPHFHIERMHKDVLMHIWLPHAHFSRLREKKEKKEKAQQFEERKFGRSSFNYNATRPAQCSASDPLQ